MSQPPFPQGASFLSVPASDVADTIRSARKRLALARWSHAGLLLAVMLGLVMGPLLRLDWLALIALLAGLVWILLVARSARLARPLRSAWTAANLGRLDAADAGARQVLEAWPLLRPMIVGALATLALSAHRRGRHGEAAQLAAFVLSRPERMGVGDRLAMQLLLVEALLAGNDLPAAHAAIMPLYSTRLALPEALRLLSLQLRIEARLGAFASMAQRLPAKVDMAELMPPSESARVQALLWLAAERLGLAEWSGWLRRRVELLAEPAALAQSEPALAGFPGGTSGAARDLRGTVH